MSELRRRMLVLGALVPLAALALTGWFVSAHRAPPAPVSAARPVLDETLHQTETDADPAEAPTLPTPDPIVEAVPPPLDEASAAVRACRDAVRARPDDAALWIELGLALRRAGAFVESLDALRRGHAIGSKDPTWDRPSDLWAAEARRLVELDRQLPDFLSGTGRTPEPEESLELARLCLLKKEPVRAARFYSDAFIDRPQLADDLDAAHRYEAARAAALALKATDDDAERTRLRRQALRWLRADLEARRRSGRAWPAGADFAVLRDPERLAALPDDERHDWLAFWTDCDGGTP